MLAVSDFHGESNGDSNLEKFLEDEYELLLILGDFTDLGPDSQVNEILSRIERANVPILAVPGNCDPKSVKTILNERNISLHSKSVRIGDLTFIGLGGSNTTPYNTPFELMESEIEEELVPLIEKAEEDWVLVTHAPPYATRADLTSDEIHMGSKSIRHVIEEMQPLVAFCGHIHEARCIDKIGRTKIVNPGTITKGYAAKAIFNDCGVEVHLLELSP